MKQLSTIMVSVFVLLVIPHPCHGEPDAFMAEVVAYVQRATRSDEGVSDRGFKGHVKMLQDERDWDSALLHIVSSDEHKDLHRSAIALLRIRGSLEKPKSAAVLSNYFKQRLQEARDHDSSDEMTKRITQGGILHLASLFAKFGGPELLQTVLEEATSRQEQESPILNYIYTQRTMVNALQTKGDQRHVKGMKKLMEMSEDKQLQEQLRDAAKKASMKAPTQ